MILVVEDDDAIVAPLLSGLARAGHTARRVVTGAAALASEPVDLVLLDLGLPDIDGSEVCRRIRARSNVPIIVVTARGEEIDRVLGLELGADDYLVKPFGFRELLARISAVMRRAGPATGETPEPVQEVGSVRFDRRAPRARRWAGGRAHAEGVRPARPAGRRSRRLCTRAEILEQVWDPHWYGPTKTLDVHVATLRKKLGDPTLIETVRGVGFRLRAL